MLYCSWLLYIFIYKVFFCYILLQNIYSEYTPQQLTTTKDKEFGKQKPLNNVYNELQWPHWSKYFNLTHKINRWSMKHIDFSLYAYNTDIITLIFLNLQILKSKVQGVKLQFCLGYKKYFNYTCLNGRLWEFSLACKTKIEHDKHWLVYYKLATICWTKRHAGKRDERKESETGITMKNCYNKTLCTL